MTCIERQSNAANVLDNHKSTTEEVEAAKKTLTIKSCHSCSNPLVRELSIDDLLCDNKS
jgi:hypothetical protein